MSKKIFQFRYYEDKNATDGNLTTNNNYPVDLTSYTLQSGTAFTDYYPIVQLGVQALPGTKFYLNANLDPIIVGTTGIYELDLNDSTAVITSLTFDKTSLELINDNTNAYLIVDMVYEED